jgi:hypothetical protein
VTTSTQDSRLFGHILPLFKAKTGIDVKVVAQGTGQALDTGRRGERRRCVRPRQIGGGEIPGGRLWREALPGDIARARTTASFKYLSEHATVAKATMAIHGESRVIGNVELCGDYALELIK